MFTFVSHVLGTYDVNSAARVPKKSSQTSQVVVFQLKKAFTGKTHSRKNVFSNNSTCTHQPASLPFTDMSLTRVVALKGSDLAAVSQLPAEAINWTRSKAFGKYESFTEQHV